MLLSAAADSCLFLACSHQQQCRSTTEGKQALLEPSLPPRSTPTVHASSSVFKSVRRVRAEASSSDWRARSPPENLRATALPRAAVQASHTPRVRAHFAGLMRNAPRRACKRTEDHVIERCGNVASKRARCGGSPFEDAKHGCYRIFASANL